MIRLSMYLIVILLFGQGTQTFAQNQALPNTLLWRISGNGLAKPSYLYGTMHLQDKRLFNFGDSVYKGIESADGFAMEIDFKEYLDSMFLTGLRNAQDEHLSQQKVKIDKKLLSKPAEALFKKFDIDKNNVTKKDLKKIRDYRLSKVLQQGEMPTIVDGYLFGLALRQKKFLGAVEDVSDQLHLSDELGSELTAENVLQADETMNKGLEELIRIYTSEDLQSIANMTGGYDAGAKDALLTRRNLKMARRMDSLTLLRTMFFAIGAAHLPGDSGVISLLKRRGFSVEPVFSSKKIPASDYTRTLADIPWYTVHDESKLYSVDMPGNPSQFHEFGDAMKMKMFFDLTSMTFYFTGQTIGNYKTEKDFEKAFELISKRMGSDEKVVSTRIPRTDMHAREATFKKDGVSFRLQLIQKNKSVFMLMAGSSSKESMHTKDIGHFFSSFVAHNPPVTKAESIKFTLPEKAFSLMLPGVPKKNEALNRQDSNATWKFTSYDFIDNTKGLYYLVQVRDLKEGFYLISDTSYFNSYINDTKAKMDTISRQGLVVYKDFPALHFDGQFGAGIFYKTFHVLRGNRVYILAIGGPTETFDDEAENFFNSLVLEEYKKAEWKDQAAQGFSTFAPVGFSKREASDDDGTKSGREHFLCFDENETVSYNVFKDKFPEYYWVKNDSTFFAEKLLSYKGAEDSIVSQKFSYTGNLKTLEAVIRKPDSHNLAHIKLLVNGDTLYSILSFVPAVYIHRDSHRNFFDSFRISNEVLPTIYTGKAARLLEALQSRDSVIFEKALDALYTTNFGVEDLPLLQNAILQPYHDSATSYVVRESLVRHVVVAEDAGTPGFIAGNYSKVSDENLKLSLLEILARTHTKPSYDTLKKLLLSDLSGNVAVEFLKSSLNDSLLLSAGLYPEILELSSNIHFANLLVSLNNALLDSGLLAFKDVKMHQYRYFSFANAQIASLKDNAEEWWQYIDWISFLARFNDKESNALLQGFLTVPSSNLKMNAIVALIKNGQPVSGAQVSGVAADKSIRSYFYSELAKIKSEHLFPAAYATQQSLAESDMYGTASDEDYEILSQSFVGERIIKHKGSMQKFYLFKVTYNIDEEKETYLGVCGPYDLKSKLGTPFGDLTGLYWNEQFSKALIDKQFKAYMLQVAD